MYKVQSSIIDFIVLLALSVLSLSHHFYCCSLSPFGAHDRAALAAPLWLAWDRVTSSSQ